MNTRTLPELVQELPDDAQAVVRRLVEYLLSLEPAEPQQPEVERGDWLQFSTKALSAAYGDDEPEYELTAIKEPNPAYEGR